MSRTRDISNIYNSDDFAGENIVSISSNYTAVDKDVIFVNTASSALTITLPANPTTGSKVKILDSASNATTNNITISGNGNKIGGSSNNYVINVVDSILSLLYIDSSRGWFLENSYVPLDLPGKPTSASAVDIGTSRAYNNGAATITFIASEAGGIADYYEVVSSPGAISASGAFSPIIVSGLQSGVSYSFAVRAKNAAGYSAYSTSSNSITATTVPQAPTINTATASGIDSATITFSANGTGGKTITNYTATSSPSSITSSASASPITFLNTLTNGTSYTFTLTATNANGTSAASSSSSSVVPFTSSGGTATTANGYRTHVFTGAGTFTYTGSARSMEYLIVGGGGGGNNADGVAGSTGGGGGGGGYLSGTSTIGTGTYTVVVGAGSPEATKGIDSSFNSLTAVGGGQGGGHNGGGGSGGSGGGGGGAWNNSTPGGAGTSGQGNSGGYGAGRDGGGGGGGGAGGTGSNGGGTYGGNGGLGLSTGISGSTLYYSGGGGGGGSWTCNGCGGTGGSGVGANGGSSGSSASANTGGGGGGGYLGGAGSGGSGVVIVRYAL